MTDDDRYTRGHCYIIHAPDVGRIKIGRALDPQRRLAELQTGSPCALILVRVLDGGTEREHELHCRFEAHRTHGEWFSDDILPEIFDLPVEYVKSPRVMIPSKRRPRRGRRKVHPNSMAAKKWGYEMFYHRGFGR